MTKDPKCNVTTQHLKQESKNPFEKLLLNNKSFTYAPKKTFTRILNLDEDVSHFVKLADKLTSEKVGKTRRCLNWCSLDTERQKSPIRPHKRACEVQNEDVIGMNCGDITRKSQAALMPLKFQEKYTHDSRKADKLRRIEENALSRIFGDSDDSISIMVKKNFSLYMKLVSCFLTMSISLLFAVIVWIYLLSQRY